MKWEEYEEIASSLLDWLQEASSLMLDRSFPTTYNELKVQLSLSLLPVMADDVFCSVIDA